MGGISFLVLVDLGGEGSTDAVGCEEGPTGAVGCGRKGATLRGEGSTGTVSCGEREGSMNVLSRLATAAPWSATRRRMASKDGVVVGWVEGTGGSSSALGLPATLPAPLWH